MSDGNLSSTSAVSSDTNDVSPTNVGQEIADMVTKNDKPLTNSELLAMVARLQSEVHDREAKLQQAEEEAAQARRQAERGFTLKVTEKGGISLYGIQRFPVTLYLSGWEKVLEMADEIRAFIEDNRNKRTIRDGKDAPLLAVKEPKPGRPVGS
jgi:hypothetical protein